MRVPREPPVPSPRIHQELNNSVVYGDNYMVAVNQSTYESSAREFRLARLAAQPLPTPTLELARARPSLLLDARLAVVDFARRGTDLAWLEAWRELTGPAISVCLLYGEGGSGKTRLARRFAADSEAAGWAVWQAFHERDAALAQLPQRLASRRERGTLLLIDYAERWPPSQLRGLLRQPLLADSGRRVRVVLLARTDGTWWRALGNQLHRDGLPARAWQVKPLSTGARGAASLFTSARDCFARVLEVPGAHAIEAPDLSSDKYRSVLAVHMAALVAVDSRLHGEPPLSGPVDDDPARLSRYLLDRELDAWHDLPPAENHRARPSGRRIARTVYTAALTGPLADHDGVAVLHRVGLADTREDAADLLDTHKLFYPALHGDVVLEPLTPDRLAEDFVAMSTPLIAADPGLADPWAADALAALLSADPTPAAADDAAAAADPAPGEVPPARFARVSQSLTILIEISRRWPRMAAEYLYPALLDHPELALTAGGAVLANLVDLVESTDTGEGPPAALAAEVLEAIEPVLPAISDFTLDSGIAALVRRLTRRRLAASVDPAERADLLKRLAWRYCRAGLNQEALAALEQAVELLRGSLDDAADPAEAQARLARALSERGRVLGMVNRPREALDAVREALELRLNADPASPDYRERLAEVRLLLADRLVSLGRYADALPVREAAVTAVRALAQDDGREPGELLATAVHNYGLSLWSDKRPDEAAAALEEAVAIYERLVADHPRTYSDGLAWALSSLGHLRVEQQRFDEALAATRRCERIYRSLYEANPQAHSAGMAAILLSSGDALATTGRSAEAADRTEEAATIYRRLAEAEPAIYSAEFAEALSSLCDRLAEVGRDAEALGCAEESVALFEPLAEDDPERYLSGLARATASLSRRFRALDRPERSVTAAQRALALWRRLDETRPDHHLPELANTLSTLAAGYRVLDETAAARGAIVEALPILRRLYDEGSDSCGADLAAVLETSAGIEAADPARVEEAVALSERALAVRRELAAANPERQLGALVSALTSFSIHLTAAGRNAEALRATDEALESARGHFAAAPDLRRLRLLGVTIMDGVYARIHMDCAPDEALALLDEIERLLSGLSATKQPERFGTDPVSLLRQRVYLLSKLGRDDEALTLLREVARLQAAEQTFQKSLDTVARWPKRLARLIDMVEPEQRLGADALAIRVITTDRQTFEHQFARRFLVRRLNRERRDEQRRATAGPDSTATATATDLALRSDQRAAGAQAEALLADLTVADALDPRLGVSGRKSRAATLLKAGDPRGNEILVAQAEDTKISYFHRQQAAHALIDARDPRGRLLLANIFRQKAADPRRSRLARWFAAGRAADLSPDTGEEPEAETPEPPSNPQALDVIRALPALGGLVTLDTPVIDELRTRHRVDPTVRGSRDEREYGLLARIAIVLGALLVPASTLLFGSALATAPASSPGLGNFLALCVTLPIGYQLLRGIVYEATWSSRKAFNLDPDKHELLGIVYLLAQPAFVLLGWLLAHNLLAFAAPAARQFWLLLIFR